jgi:hypothetical protein
MLLFEESAQFWTWKVINKQIRYIWAVLIQHFEQKCNGSLDQSKYLHFNVYLYTLNIYNIYTKSKLHLGWNNTLWPFSCISKMMVQFFFNSWFCLYYLLPALMCYILLNSFHISTNFKVFPFKWYQEYAYPCFRAWAMGSHFRQKLNWKQQEWWQQHLLHFALPYMI